MGGDCSAHAWRQLDPPAMRGDHVHFTSEGGDAVAALLYADLMAAAARPAATVPPAAASPTVAAAPIAAPAVAAPPADPKGEH